MGGREDGRRLRLVRAGGGGHGRSHAACLGSLPEKFDHVRDVRVATRLERFLDLHYAAPEVGGRFRIDAFDLVAVFADKVIARVRLAEIDRVKAGAVVIERPAHEANFFKGGQATIDRHQIARLFCEIAVDLLNARRLVPLNQRAEDRDTGLGNPQTRLLQMRASDSDWRLTAGSVGFAADQRMICLGRSDHL